MLLCIDPGAKAAGVALFEGGELTTAWLSRGKDWIETADDVIEKMPVSAVLVQTVILERMQIYSHTRLAHANDCITLSLMAGRVSGRFSHCRVVTYLPSAWKGGTKKEIMTRRIEGLISDDEKARIDVPRAKSLMHNVYDAIGIGIRHTRGKRALGY